MVPLILVFFLLSTILILSVALLGVKSWGSDSRLKKKGMNLPPGNMGWPLIGETFAFRKLHPSISLGEYMEDHIRKYGKIYKSHLFGKPSIVSADAELNRFVLRNDEKLFQPCFPKSVVDILGNTAMLITFNLIVKNILSMNPGEPETEALRYLYKSFMQGVISLPLNFPGTAYKKAMQARVTILKTIERLMRERIELKKAGKDKIGGDLLGFVLEQSNLDSEQFGDLLLGLLFGGHETSSTAITLVLYFLHDCPKAVQQLREEHLGILKKKKARGEPKALTWEDYKHMEFSQCVVSETLRLGNIVKFVQRKAVTDVRFKGYDIPEGWALIPILAAAHLDSNVYENPQKFDPWRWLTISSSSARIDNYMPFGQGLRNCAGLELAKLEIVVFLHHLVINFDWEMPEPDHPVAYAFPEFEKGLPIKVRRLSLIDY